MADASTKKRNDNIDIMKGIAIIFMVYGHTFGLFREWVYLFHMPVFFMISGYLFNVEHVANKKNAYIYWFEKLKRLIIPYMLCNIIIMLLNNVWVYLGFLNSTDDFLQAMRGSVNPQCTFGLIDKRTAFINIYKIIILRYIPQLASPTWFLTVLFGVISLQCLLASSINKVSSYRYFAIIYGLVFIIMLLVSWYIDLKMPDISNTFELRHLRIIPAYTAFLLGFLLKIFVKINKVRFYYYFGIIGFFLLFLAIKLGVKIELTRCNICNPIIYVVCMLSGWCLLFFVSIILQDIKCGKLFIYIGKHTLPILLLHMISFRIFSFIYVSIRGLPSYLIASSPVIFETTEFVKIVYTIVGVIIPLIAYQLYVKLKIYLKII